MKSSFGQAYLNMRKRSVEPLLAHFPEEGRIVDLGCGVGALIFRLAESGPRREIIGVDHDKDRIAFLNQRKPAGVEVVEADIRTYDVPPAAATALVDVLHYLSEAEQDALLERAANALEPDGVLVLRDCDVGLGWRFLWNRFHERVATGIGFTQASIGHYRTAAEWAEALERNGLEAEILPPGRGPYADRVIVGRQG